MNTWGRSQRFGLVHLWYGLNRTEKLQPAELDRSSSQITEMAEPVPRHPVIYTGGGDTMLLT